MRILETSGNDVLREGVFQQALDGPLQGPGPINKVKALVDQQVNGVFGKLNLDFLFLQTLDDLVDLQLDDIVQVLFGQRFEDNDIVNEVKEFGLKCFFHLFQEAGFHVLVSGILLLLDKPQRSLLAQHFSADVGRHQDNRVAEVDLAPKTAR